MEKVKEIAYYNGKIGSASELTVPFLDRAIFFGDGCYDAALNLNGMPIDLELHLDRFYNSCRLMKIPFSMKREELRALLLDLVSRVEGDVTMLYWQTSRGTAPRIHCFPPEGTEPNLLVTVTKKAFPDVFTAAPVITTEDTRYFHCNIKTINLFPNVMANQKAHENGAFETVFVRPDGYVTEGSHTNISILKNGVLKTHEDGPLVLPGISKKHMLATARKLGIPVEEKAFTVEELIDADEVIITSSTIIMKRASSVDQRALAMSDETLYRKLACEYLREVSGQTGYKVTL